MYVGSSFEMAGRGYRDVALAVPGAGLYIDVAVAIKCFGVATSYLIVIGDSVPKAIVAFGASGLWLDRRVWTLAQLRAEIESIKTADEWAAEKGKSRGEASDGATEEDATSE